MNIDFLQSGSDDCPLIRIYGGEPAVCQQLREAFQQLADGDVDEVLLTDLPGVKPLRGCCLIAQAGRHDKGVVRTGGSDFAWVVTPATWDNVAGLIEPFRRIDAGGYQWLDQVPASEVRILVSTSKSGCW